MKINRISFFLLLASMIQVNAQKPWQQFSDKRSKDIKKEFRMPPAEYGAILWWGWDGPVNDTVIMRDLDRIKAQGFCGVMIEAGYGMTAKYLTPEWFSLVRTGVLEAKKRGMKVWIEDEGKYPSGFAGGKFSQERPDLKMQGLVVTERIENAGMEPFTRKTAPGTLSAVAVNMANNEPSILDVKNGEIKWAGKEGTWRIITAGPRFRSSVTRSVNNLTRGKDTTASLMDYLNPAATKQFLAWTHEQYKKAFGEEFGKTFMGFMGDEPDFAYTPWTPVIVEEFNRKKGYDVRPYLASFFVQNMTDEQKRVKADYWDVWSDLFRDSFFKVQADWCRENGIEYIVHLNHEDQLPGLVRSSGDYFKNMRDVAVPGIDAIWAQIWMDHVSDFPKLASSAAHLYGRPRAFTESFAAYTYRPTVPQAKWVIDYQMVRGINSVQIMFMSASASRRLPPPPQIPGRPPVGRSSFFLSDTFPQVAAYINRATYLLSQGRPVCKTGVYIPSSSMWLSDNESNTSLLAISKQLLESQYDFDYIDEQALSSLMKISDGKFINLSGQEYSTLIIPKSSLLSKASAERLKAFAEGGGKVIFMAKYPGLISGKNILTAEKPSDLSWSLLEASGNVTADLLKKMPSPEFRLATPDISIKYLHRRLPDADVWFIFNEAKENKAIKVSLAGSGKAEEWNAETGIITKIKPSSKEASLQTFSLDLKPWETKFIVINN